MRSFTTLDLHMHIGSMDSKVKRSICTDIREH